MIKSFIICNILVLCIFAQEIKSGEYEYKKADFWYEKALNYEKAGLSEKSIRLFYKEAIYWFIQSAELDNDNAYFRMGYLYDAGEGLIQNDEKAIFWYEKSANSGSADAQYNLALIFKRLKKMEKSTFWYEKAGENGDVDAQEYLADFFEKSDESKKALYWYKKLSTKGRN